MKKIQEIFAATGLKLPKLDSHPLPIDIDPFSVYALFNKHTTLENRIKLVTAFKDSFSIDAPVPQEFNGIPLVNNMAATFYAFDGDPRRKPDDIDNLWALFEIALFHADRPTDKTREDFIRIFNNTYRQFGLRWMLSFGLYWIRPHTYMNLDSNTREFLSDPSHTSPDIVATLKRLSRMPDAERYLSICESLKETALSKAYSYSSFPELSESTWNVPKPAPVQTSTDSTNVLGDPDIASVRYWLLAPGKNASEWSKFQQTNTAAISWADLGNLDDYPSKDDIQDALIHSRGGETSHNNAALACWQFAHEMKPGDIIWAKRGRQEIIGRGVVSGAYEFDESKGDYPHFRSVDWTDNTIFRTDDLLSMKTLTDLTTNTELVSRIEGFYNAEKLDEVDDEPVIDYPEYSPEDFLSEVFMSPDKYESLTNILQVKKNIILQGAPGVGKTFAAKRLAYSLMGEKDVSRVMMVQFHQSYSYEDFIEGYRPSANGFELTKGAFYSFCKKAADDSENDYFFIIDEINRGNLSKIFGELFMLIENDKRGSKNTLQLLYSHELFYVPSNVYLIGMMNTADRSLAMLDYALRRRFAFFDLTPGFQTEKFIEYRDSLGEPKFNALLRQVELLNEVIAQDDSLGDGFCIGHSYFCNLRPGSTDDAALVPIVEYELIPLLKEYWFDDPSRIADWSDRLRGAIR
ncbi:AAA family ATPase [Actinomyces vulturis]|uniref:AAA family ATPase n=1 Tax=Actinomyces vulturis TaxID=1857645 RepID=UPI001FE0A07A|nr:AAA family ATPase [Actinomyces vulturis]